MKAKERLAQLAKSEARLNNVIASFEVARRRAARAGGATAADVRLLKASVGGRAKVKASGGIRDWHSAREMLEAGADRIGTSASLKIVEEWSAATVKR